MMLIVACNPLVNGKTNSGRIEMTTGTPGLKVAFNTSTIASSLSPIFVIPSATDLTHPSRRFVSPTKLAVNIFCGLV